MSQKEIDSQIKNTRESIDKLENAVKSTIEQLNSQNNLNPIQNIKVPWINNCKVREFELTGSYSTKCIRLDVPKECVKILNNMTLPIKGDKAWGYYEFYYNSENSKDSFISVLNAIEKMDKVTEQENSIANQINTRTRDTTLKMLTDLGISKQKYGYSSGRSKKKEWINCNWYGEIFSSFPIYSGNVAEIKKKLIETFDKLYKADQNKRKAEEQKKQNEINRKESERQLAFLLAKYGLDITSDWDDLLLTIIEKDKYLYLAYWLEKNRGNWNDGYSYAKIGLSEFSIETAQDEEIYNNINNIIETCEDIDGRYFRDCTWNYSVLFSMVEKNNPELCSDYQKAREKITNY